MASMASMASVDVLIATYNRPESLVMTLAGVAAQTQRDLRVIVADQSDEPVGERQTILTLRRVIEAHGGLRLRRRLPVGTLASRRRAP